ncbi:MAG: 2-oxo acid dehydrogenase subunit E2 [Myxococcota bacterium]|nr:2-oxo acid dehydrogenase subunit E2 [Deltaproteobacteria bacterium]MDQ3339826.1 2-oxo acid dehydrogenase subunit E2 [Myxococcota bacterium]
MSQFTPVEDASSFRRMAAAMWRSPSDPSIYGSMDVDATAALAFMAAQPTKITITHLVARAVALAMRAQPELNAKVRFWGRLEQRKTIDVFVTVATEGNRDLSGARIDRADEKSLAELAAAIADRAGRIRKGQDASYKKSRSVFTQLPWWLARPATQLSDLLVNELHVDLGKHGMPSDPFGSAIVTSVGMFGIDSAFAPFVPLARCPMLILVPEIRPRPWAVGDRAVVRPVLRLCATFDHRIIDGAAAGRFAARLTQLFAQPDALT